MGKGTYSGGGTTIRLGEDGTNWDSSDAAENRKRYTRTSRDDYKRPTKNEIDVELERESQVERKALRSFISQCVTEHAAGKLTALDPRPPKILRKRVGNAGGNIKWLEGNRTYQVLFHESYCRLRNENIPFEKVWGPRGR